MRCSQLTDEGFIQVPMRDLIQSFRGPLVKRSSSSWTDTPVVQYFHVLPYSEIISEWFSRETFSSALIFILLHVIFMHSTFTIITASSHRSGQKNLIAAAQSLSSSSKDAPKRNPVVERVVFALVQNSATILRTKRKHAHQTCT
ncbi:hypothetical protein RYX36_022490 [Vicia faba]